MPFDGPWDPAGQGLAPGKAVRDHGVRARQDGTSKPAVERQGVPLATSTIVTRSVPTPRPAMIQCSKSPRLEDSPA